MFVQIVNFHQLLNADFLSTFQCNFFLKKNSENMILVCYHALLDIIQI